MIVPDEIVRFGPEWLVVLVVVLVGVNYAGRMLAEASETWAKLLGPLGKRWRDRGLKRQQERINERDARQADLEDMTVQRDNLSKALSGCRRQEHLMSGYIEYDATWHRDTRLRAIEAGCEMPAHKSFLQWSKDAAE